LLAEFFQHLINAASLGSVYALIALGLTLIFGTLGVVNFAHGALFMLGSYIGFTLAATGHWWLGLIVSVVAMAAVGCLLDALVFRSLRKHDHIVTVLITVGLLVAPVRTALWVRPFWHMDQPQRDAAARFDAMLDACGWDRYLPYGPDTEDLWAHTAHSPYSAAFTLFKLDASRMDPTLADMAFADFNRTPVIAVYPSFVPTLMDQTQGTLLSAFTETPPECAKTFVPMMDSRGQPYVLYFRK
jgi:branched-subunit amino acid ABC-type transport system permease component